jgi:protein disulfide-isomerase
MNKLRFFLKSVGVLGIILLCNLKLNAQEKMKIEIWSDVVCPFCYIGKHKLEKALSNNGLNDKVEVVWKSFQLDPEFPQNDVFESTTYLIQRKGISMQQLNQMYSHLETIGKEYAIDFKFHETSTFNTFKAHQLLQWAKNFGKGSELKEALFYAYFTEAKVLNSDEELLKVCAKLDLDLEQAKLVLTENKFSDKVLQDRYEAGLAGVRGVPFFVIGKSVISGAQADDVFEKIVQKELKQYQKENQKSQTSTKDGGICLPSSECK